MNGRILRENSKMTTMVRTWMDLSTDTRKHMVALLNQHLADLADLHSQCKQAHWNVKGQAFFQLHELYDGLAQGLMGHIDTVAERVTALGGVATGTVRMAAATSRLPDFPADAVADTESIELLCARFSAAAKTTRHSIDAADQAGDKGTADLFTEIVRDLDKWLWFLEAHQQSKS